MIQEEIRNIAAGLLGEKKLCQILGFAKGTTPFAAKPVIINDPADAEGLVWNGFCAANLVKHIPEDKKGLGIIANGCISRTILVHLQEGQLKREDLFIIGVPCPGMTDRQKIRRFGKEFGKIKAIKIEDKKAVISGEAYSREFPLGDLLREACLYCRHKNPVVYDVAAGELTPEEDVIDEAVKSLENMPPEKRAEYFRSLFASCNLCFACRNVCPLCYCPKCFTEDIKPAGAGSLHTNAFIYHLTRAMHLAGRCTGCGNCDSACPKAIPVSRLFRKLNKDILELFHSDVASNEQTPLPLSVCDPRDPQFFVLRSRR